MKDYTIICPYCFREFSHKKVHFRSERVNKGECEALPEQYDDIEDFKIRYRGNDKEEILRKCMDWAFFQETEDQKYEQFWNDPSNGFGGTTEYNPADEKLGVLSYKRKVIDPENPQHQKYLKKQQDGGYLIYDADGLATNIELFNDETCNRRVCPHCHNPLPGQYGKYPVKFTTVIGITGAGKTVYLSQLIKFLRNYAPKVGLSAQTSTVSARVFLDNNVVKENVALPGSTPPERLLQPLFYDLVRMTPQGRVTQTFVLYDVAGENCVNPDLMHRFGRFIENAHGIFLLIDPAQFSAVKEIKQQASEAAGPTEVLDAIHNLVSRGSAELQCDIPIAVCISKSDTEIQDVLDSELCSQLMEEVEGLKDKTGHGLTLFNASKYNPVAEGLRDFMMANEIALEQMLYVNYSVYNYFAFTALGCDVSDDGKPIGPILPKRIEEPLFWLFHQFGYIDSDVPIFQPGRKNIRCPECDSQNVEELPEDQRTVVQKKLFKKKIIYVSHKCSNCGHMWNQPEE
ncbi:GTPase domain-containing protein [bacterium]|nr:GTPase domain-containing protein [bacterium]MDY3023145.1 GTPase domain-containing protein [Oliverpabstia sp.]